MAVKVAITFESESQPSLSESKRCISNVIPNFKWTRSCFYSVCVEFWLIQSAIRVTNTTQSIVGEISKLTDISLLPPFVSSFKMDRQWSNGAKPIKTRQSSTDTIKPRTRKYFPRRGSIATPLFLQFGVSFHKPLTALKQCCAAWIFYGKVGPTWGPNTGVTDKKQEGGVKSKHKITIEKILPDSCQTFACITNVVSMHPRWFSRHLHRCKQKSAVSICHMDSPHVFSWKHQVCWHGVLY